MGGEQERVGFPTLCVAVGERVVVTEQVDDGIAPLEIEIGIAARVIAGRCLRNRRERGRLREIDLPHRLAEVALRRGLHPVSPVAQVDLIQIQLENLILGVLPLDLERDLDLLELATQRLVPAADVLRPEIARQLHGDVENPSANRSLKTFAFTAPKTRSQSIPPVLVEPFVLGGDECRFHIRATSLPAGRPSGARARGR